MKVKKKQMVKHSRFVLNSPFLDRTQERIAKTNEKLGFYSKKTMAVLIAISTMATPLMASPAYAKSSDSSSSVGTTSDSSKDVESSTSAEVNDEAGEEPEPYQCSGDYVDYENTELLTDGDGAGEITCAQSNGVYYKLTDGNKASSYHWIAWYRDKSQDEVDVSDDDGNYTGFSSSKVSAWTPYQSEIEELNDGAFPESKSYTYPTDTTTGSLDFWADIAGNYTVLGDPKYDSLELTAYEQVVYARTEEVEEPYEIPSDEDVSADDAGGSAGGSGVDTGNGTGSSGSGEGSEEAEEGDTVWSAYRYCNTSDRKQINDLLKSLGYDTSKNKSKNGIDAEKKLFKDYNNQVSKIYKDLKKLGISVEAKDGNSSSKVTDKSKLKEIEKYIQSEDFVNFYKIYSTAQAIYRKSNSKSKLEFSQTGPSLMAHPTIKSLIEKYQSKFNFDTSVIDNSKAGDAFCKVTERSQTGEYTKADGTKIDTKIVKKHDTHGNTTYTKYVKNKEEKTWHLYAKGNNSDKKDYKKANLEFLRDYSGVDEETFLHFWTSEEIDNKMNNYAGSGKGLSDKEINKALEDNEVIGDPDYEAGEAAYSEDAGYTVIKSTTTTYYYMNVEIAKATINNVYATELAQLDNLGIVKGSGNNVQAKISKDTDGFWGDTTPSYWENEGTLTINNDSSTIYHFDTVDSRNGYGYTDDEYSVDLYSLLIDHDKISKFIHGYNNIKDSKASSKNYPKGAEENCITTKSSTGKSSQVCSKAQTPLMKQTLVINEDSQDQEELDDEQVETNVTLTKDNDKEDDSSKSTSK